MCSTFRPPHQVTHCRRVTNPVTAECRISGSIHDSSRRIISFNFDRLNGRDRCTREFKYPNSQKFTGVRSGDQGGHENLQRFLRILSSPKFCIKNSLTGLAMWLVAPSCKDVTIASALFSRKHRTTFHAKALNNAELLMLPFAIHLLDTVFQRRRALWWRNLWTQTTLRLWGNAVVYLCKLVDKTSPWCGNYGC